MPEFAPSEAKAAIAPITVTPSELSCEAEFYLVSNSTKVATSGIKTFTSTGAKQDIRFPITMPGAEGTYPVYLDVFVEGILIGAYRAIEDVVIKAAVVGFTLGVESAPSPASQWMAQCDYYGAGAPRMTAPLPLAQRWICTEPAPGYKVLGIACFDAAGYIVQESIVIVNILDGKDYTFNFATKTLREV